MRTFDALLSLIVGGVEREPAVVVFGESTRLNPPLSQLDGAHIHNKGCVRTPKKSTLQNAVKSSVARRGGRRCGSGREGGRKEGKEKALTYCTA